ncbi:ferredoxin--NADP+ reductase [Allochromatium warmingii]|uniref:ferredoxin--NADP(+) reductase n=1 Tax=Allochromatium warmingii TaxID=61595 RepID=A0A1H3IYR3_ALLWA|nr:ferredoxin--NADP reductase [Allochromatium warmingii]SDY32860.1 ferredoxin--NADP+ reductase [Allochromatium warmingii]
MSDWIQARVVGRQCWAESLYSVQFEAAISDFAAGQYIKVALDIDGERVGRPYSLVNAPGEQPIEIFFNAVPEGPLTTRLAALNAGDTVWMTATASGIFTLESVQPSRDLWLLATGTGLGVYLSMLRSPEPWRLFERVVLVHGVRLGADLAYRETLEAIAQRYLGRLTCVAAVSREAWPPGLSGRITDLLTSGALERHVGLTIDPAHSHVMLCGNSAMIKDTKLILEERGLVRHRRQVPGQYSTEQYH